MRIENSQTQLNGTGQTNSVTNRLDDGLIRKEDKTDSCQVKQTEDEEGKD